MVAVGYKAVLRFIKPLDLKGDDYGESCLLDLVVVAL